MFNFDPSQMDPKVLMQMSELVRQLPPDKLNRMQSLMHNMMAGFDVSKEMEEFEKSLPPSFREKLLSIVASSPNAFAGAPGMPPGMSRGAAAPNSSTIQPPGASAAPIEVQAEAPKDLREARLTILRAVAEKHISPDEAERMLFGEG
jgi:hypothetical protein